MTSFTFYLTPSCHSNIDSLLFSLSPIFSHGGSVGGGGGGLSGLASDHGTPSRLSVGSSGWNTPTPNTWTEGTPSYTPSSLSHVSSLGVNTAGDVGVGASSLDDVCDVCLSDVWGDTCHSSQFAPPSISLYYYLLSPSFVSSFF